MLKYRLITKNCHTVKIIQLNLHIAYSLLLKYANPYFTFHILSNLFYNISETFSTKHFRTYLQLQ